VRGGEESVGNWDINDFMYKMEVERGQEEEEK
jgi:hypothetical protein